MKKKFLSFILAMCLLIPCSFTLVACENKTKHECAFETSWTKDETYHWHKCTGSNCDEVSDKAEHIWDAGEITTPATSSAQGVKTYTCTVCGQTKTGAVDYVSTKTITEAEWNNAVSFTGITNYSMTTLSSANVNFINLVKVDGNRVYYKQVQYPTISDAGASFYSESIYVKNGTTYRYYSKHEGNWIDQTRYNSNSTIESMFLHSQPSETFMMFEYSQFTYNSENGKYECASITIEGETISNISLEFEGGRLKSGSFNLGGVIMSYSLSYEPCTVTVPTIKITKTMTEEQWIKALIFEGINNFSIVNTSPNDADYSGLHIVDGDKLYYYQIGGFGAGSDMEWSKDYYEVVGLGADVKYYEYSKHSHNSTNWTRREVDADYYNEMKPQNQFAFFQYESFTYNAETGKYECESMNMGDFSITGIVLAFEDGYLVEVTMTVEGETHNMTISYEVNTLTIPTSFVNGQQNSN